MPPRILAIRDLDVARRFPLQMDHAVRGLPRGQDHDCEKCGDRLEPVVVTTWSDDGALWAAYPLAVDGWRCAGCAAVLVPAFLTSDEARELLQTGADMARRGELDAAEFYFRRLVNSWPDLTLARVNLGSLYQDRLARELQGDNRPDVVQRLSRVMEEQLVAALHGQTPAPPHAYVSLGRLYRSQDRLEESTQYLDAYLGLDADLPPESRDEARRMLANNLYRRAVDLIDPHMLLRERSAPPDAAADDALRAGIDHLTRVIDLRPDHWQSWWILGKAHQALSENDDALAAFEKSHALAPDQPDVTRELALALLAVGKGDDAVRACERAIDAEPGDPGLHANLALALLVAGRVDDASHAVARACEMDPDDPVTANLSAMIRDVQEGERARPTRWPPA